MSSKQISGKYLLVTGSASGIGYACVHALVSAGAHVFAGVRREADLEKFSELASNVTPLMLDVTDGNAIRSAASMVADRTGGQGLYGLVNNAGYAFACPLEFVPLDQLRQQFEVNVIGQLAVTQAMLPALRTAVGRIINVNSISGHIAGPYVGPYAASKHAFASLNDSLRLELRSFGIKVVQIIPGDIATPIWDKSRQRADELRDEIAERLAVGLPESVQAVYTTDIQAMRAATNRFAKEAIPVQRVVDQIMRALLSKRPAIRYVVGARAWGAVHVLKMLPQSLRDRIVLNNLRMK